MTDTPTAPTAPTLTAVTLPHSAALLNGLYAVALHASRDDITAVICTVQITGRYFLATDRYSIGRFEHTAPVDGYAAHAAEIDPFSIVIPRTAAEWLAKQTGKALGFGPRETATDARIVFTADSITIERDGDVLAVTRFAPVGGAFPPVGRLLDNLIGTDIALPTRLDPIKMERFTKGAHRVNERNEPLGMEFSKTENPNKPGPVIFTFGAFRGCLQPNLMLR